MVDCWHVCISDYSRVLRTEIEREGCVTQEAKSTQSAPTDTSEGDATASTPILLVVGAGPKAVAIAAKRHMLAKLGYPMPHVRIIDRRGVATNCTGNTGFTDGHQFLGTRPEKDIGFPYLSACWGVRSSCTYGHTSHSR